jgi:hypothetical protein
MRLRNRWAFPLLRLGYGLFRSAGNCKFCLYIIIIIVAKVKSNDVVFVPCQRGSGCTGETCLQQHLRGLSAPYHCPSPRLCTALSGCLHWCSGNIKETVGYTGLRPCSTGGVPEKPTKGQISYTGCRPLWCHSLNSNNTEWAADCSLISITK